MLGRTLRNHYQIIKFFWHDNYNGAPTDGSAWESGGDSKSRLLRGGSWGNNARFCRAAQRTWLSPDARNDMSFDWSQYLNLAKELAGQATIPAEQEARLRDAISRSYYLEFFKAIISLSVII